MACSGRSFAPPLMPDLAVARRVPAASEQGAELAVSASALPGRRSGGRSLSLRWPRRDDDDLQLRKVSSSARSRGTSNCAPHQPRRLTPRSIRPSAASSRDARSPILRLAAPCHSGRLSSNVIDSTVRRSIHSDRSQTNLVRQLGVDDRPSASSVCGLSRRPALADQRAVGPTSLTTCRLTTNTSPGQPIRLQVPQNVCCTTSCGSGGRV
jgi:hypothetical protein